MMTTNYIIKEEGNWFQNRGRYTNAWGYHWIRFYYVFKESVSLKKVTWVLLHMQQTVKHRFKNHDPPFREITFDNLTNIPDILSENKHRNLLPPK